MTNLESTTELVRDVKELTVQVAQVVKHLELWTPILDRQTTGMVDLTNRITRMEDGLEALKNLRNNDREQERQEFEERIKAVEAWISIVAVSLTVAGHFWK